MAKRERLLIINRSFWPIYPVIGEALLQLAERKARDGADVNVVLQDHAGIRQQLELHQRGQGVRFFPCKAWSISGSSIVRRIADAVFFMLWVAWSLLRLRPSMVYVSTDPPVLVPFIVMLYCKLFGARFVYHLQDIHPEAANVVVKLNPLVFRFFRYLDAASMRNATRLITITGQMAEEIRARSKTTAPVEVVPNPSVAFDGVTTAAEKVKGFTFCGNAGRLQRIPLLMEAIELYCARGGGLPFVFAGAGVYGEALRDLARRLPANVEYRGLITAAEAAQLNCDYEWALLPIEDEVTRYAFPSKSSSYVFAGAFIVAVCGGHTSVAEWVTTNHLGTVVAPEAEALCEFFFAVERGEIDASGFDIDRSILKKQLGFDVFVEKLDALLG